MNSIAFNKIYNKKKQIEDYRKATIEGIPTGNMLPKNDFLEKRQQYSNSNYSPDLRMSGSGKIICEKMMQATKDETEYFNNKKIFTKETEESKYKK
jgi:hypothetical protein